MSNQSREPIFTENGNAIIEFAIVLSFFMIMLAATFDYSLAIQEKAIMADAARVAGRAAMSKANAAFCLGSCPPGNVPNIVNSAQTTAQNFMTDSGYRGTDYRTLVSFRKESSTYLMTVKLERIEPRALMFVPGTVVASSQASVYRVKGNYCGGSQSC